MPLRHFMPLVLVGLLMGASSAPATLAATGFTYQGQLRDGSAPVTDNCDFQFSLFDAAMAGTQLGPTQTLTNVSVGNGRFTVLLNDAGQFGARAFDGSVRWLAIALRCPTGAGSYTPLTPRQPLTAAPLALALPGLRTEPNATSPNVVGGHVANTVGVSVIGATIGGGGFAGQVNAVGADYGTVSGGESNSALGAHSTVAGGYANAAQGPWSVVAGGLANYAASDIATVSGGQGNQAIGTGAMIPGGYSNNATGAYSFAAGSFANAAHGGAFVWNCLLSCDINFSSGADNQFVINAAGGYWLGKGGSTTGPGGALPANHFISTTTGAYLSTAGVWTDSSDRNVKTAFAPINGPDLLNALMRLPVESWSYKVDDAGVRHIGPTAQDFHTAFGVGADDTHLAALDTSGVALAAIQSMYGVVQEKDAEIGALQAAQAELRARVAALEAGNDQIQCEQKSKP